MQFPPNFLLTVGAKFTGPQSAMFKCENGQESEHTNTN